MFEGLRFTGRAEQYEQNGAIFIRTELEGRVIWLYLSDEEVFEPLGESLVEKLEDWRGKGK